MFDNDKKEMLGGDATRWEIAITSESQREMMNKYILWQLNHVLPRVTQSSRLTSSKSKSKKGAIKKVLGERETRWRVSRASRSLSFRFISRATQTGG